MMLNLMVGDAGPCEHVTPHPMRIGEYYHICCPHNPSHALWEWVLLPLYSGDSGLRSSLLVGIRRGPREGCKTISGRSGMACPVSHRQGPPLPMLDRRPPTGLVGILRSLWSLATPTLPASELGGVQKADLV